MVKLLSNDKVQFKYFFLYSLILNIYCRSIYKENKTINYVLEPGKVYNLNLYKLKTTNITFLNINDEENYVVHFYPLECKIYLTDSNDNEDNIYRISNYNYDASYSLISKDNSSFIIKPLIYSINEEIKNIICPLIINSVKINNSEVPELVLNEKEPVLFYFKDNITKLNLIFNHDNNKNPIIVSFFIKERVRFTVECNEGEEIINKTIYYKETILLKPNTSNIKYNFLITRNDPIDSVMIIKISGDNSSAFYLQNNILNFGFIPKNEIYQYYYMKVYKGQEGEIVLNTLNKWICPQIIITRIGIFFIAL